MLVRRWQPGPPTTSWYRLAFPQLPDSHGGCSKNMTLYGVFDTCPLSSTRIARLTNYKRDADGNR